MRINVIATGSAGNLYELIDKNGSSIVIEAGVNRATFVKNRVGKSPPDFCIISHKHSDHYKYWGEFKAIMPTYFLEEKVQSENWKVFSFPMKHGDVLTSTFLIKNLAEEKFLYFATDIEYFNENGEIDKVCERLKFHKVENFLIECNYNDCLIHMKDVTNDMRTQCKRHLSDNNVISFIKKTGAKNPKIITIHGSNRLSADTHTKKYLSSKLLNATVEVASNGKKFNI